LSAEQNREETGEALSQTDAILTKFVIDISGEKNRRAMQIGWRSTKKKHLKWLVSLPVIRNFRHKQGRKPNQTSPQTQKAG
jgi:hypothetical protein